MLSRDEYVKRAVKAGCAPLALVAVDMVTQCPFADEPGNCQRFVRRCYEVLFADMLEAYHQPTAHLAAMRWRKSRFAVPGTTWGVAGDIYYWYATANQRAGHAAIRVLGNRVAENSTVHEKGKLGGRGFRALSQLRQPDLIVRLGFPKPVTPTL